ncbi:MAG TPA: dynamin family protein, partial [Burkholderiaceae bacterium]
INAIFFADTGRRILPATPGRTTMCPVELAWNEAEKPMLDLLPIDTRREGSSLAELRQTREGWKRVPLDPSNPAALAESLAEVTATLKVTPDVARELSLWSDSNPEDNPPLDEQGLVEVPAWRHAMINYPHPLLARGLVVLDTPGLNAIGTEPELTLGLLPGAHAALFLLGADQGVTKSDLAVWNEHLGGQAMACFVVLNKVDMLADPLMSPAQNEAAVQKQCEVTAQTLQMPRDRVFPVSARQALHARLNDNELELAKSRLPELESALTNELLPARQQVLTHAVVAGVEALRAQVNARLRDQRRQNSEQLLELRGLRGKSGARVRHLLDRVQEDAAEFERCVTRLTALRAVQTRLLRDTQNQLSSERIRAEVKQLQDAMNKGWLHLGARSAFLAMCDKLRHALSDSEVTTSEAREMLQGTFRQLNAEFGFSLSIALPPELSKHREELAAIERGYNRYFGLSETLRMASPAFKERFVRMLVSKLRVVFETAARDIELWHQSGSAQMESQLRDRRRSFRKRRESLERIQQAAGDLEERLADVEGQAARIEALIADVQTRSETLAVIARRGPLGIESEHFDLPIDSSSAAAATV